MLRMTAFGAEHRDCVIRSCEQRDNHRFKDHLESAAWKETEDVLSCSEPTRERSTQSTAELAVEINAAEFAEYLVAVPSTLSGSAARLLAGVLFRLT